MNYSRGILKRGAYLTNTARGYVHQPHGGSAHFMPDPAIIRPRYDLSRRQRRKYLKQLEEMSARLDALARERGVK